MARLEHVPDEIWVEILSNLPSCHLANPCLVSRRMHDIAYPLLYKSPYLAAGNRYPSCLQLFLRTLLAPGGETLAGWVRVVDIGWNYGAVPRDHPDGPCFLAALTCHGLPHCIPTEGVLVVLLLYLLPGLQVLDALVPDPNDAFCEFMDDLHTLQPVARIPIGLQSLRDFTCDFYTPPEAVSTETFLTLLCLPNIRAIKIPVQVGLPFSSSQTVLTAELQSSVKELTFHTARISDTSLKRVLAIPHALTHFRYYASREDSSFDFTATGLALRQQQASLETLVVNFRARIWLGGLLRQATSIGSLHDWHALKRLKCTLLALLGNRLNPPPGLEDVLPRGIRDLEIVDDDYWTAEQAAQRTVVLLRKKDVVVPRLETVAVYRNREKCTELREQLLAAGNAAGVHVEERRWGVSGF